jgi:hypothetical protein
MCLFFCGDVQLFGDSPESLAVFGSPFFVIFASRLLSILFARSLLMALRSGFPDSGSSYDILDLADVADVFVANSSPQC